MVIVVVVAVALASIVILFCGETRSVLDEVSEDFREIDFVDE